MTKPEDERRPARVGAHGAPTGRPAAEAGGGEVPGDGAPKARHGRRRRAHARPREPRRRARLVGYVRVSTPGQADGGASLEDQERAIRRYVEANDAHLVAVERDAGLSGRTTRRAGLQRALARLRGKGADGVVVARLDRLSRSLRDAVDLFARARNEGWEIHSLAERLDTASPSGVFVCHVLAAMAEWEREMAGERTRNALAELRRQGRRVSGRPPFGYAFRDGRVVEVPAELALLRRLQGLAARGLGAKAIASRMNAAGAINPRTGRRWHHGVVRDVLASAARRKAREA